MAPLVPNSGPPGRWTADSRTGLSARWWWVCDHRFHAPARRSGRRGTPGHSPSRGARAKTVLAHRRRWWGVGNTWVAWTYHHRSRAGPWCCRRFQGSGGAGAACLRPGPRPRPRGPRTMGRKGWWQVAGGPGQVTEGPGQWSRGGTGGGRRLRAVSGSTPMPG